MKALIRIREKDEMRWQVERRGVIASALVVAALCWASPLVAQVGPQEEVLTLEQALDRALRRNAELREARLGLDGAEAQVREAWSFVYPQVDLTASFARNLSLPSSLIPAQFFDPEAGPDDFIAVQFGTDNNWSSRLRIEQPIFEPAAFIAVGSAGRYRELEEERVRGTSQGVATRVRVSYYDVLLAQESVRLSENSVERVRQTLEETRAMQRAGLGSASDVLRLEVELANLEPELRRNENRLAASRRQFAIDIEWDDDPQQLRVAGSLATMVLDPDEPATDSDVGSAGAGANGDLLRFGGLAGTETLRDEEVKQLALSNRSQLKQLQLTEHLRRAELRVEQSAYLPTVSVFGTYTIDAQQSGRPVFFGDSQNRFYARQIGVQVSLPLFGGLRRPALVEQRRVGLQQAQTQYRLARDQTEHDIETLLADLREARERAASQRRNIERAQRSYEMVSAEYREGIGSRIEVTDAEVALRQSEFNYAEAVYDYLVARARLDEAAGTVPLVDRDR